MVGEKIRLRFSKTGLIQFLSHLDLMRCFERMARRGTIPFRFTQGFHPSPRLVLPLSLSLGLAGRNEVLEVELTEPLDAEDIRSRFNRQAPQGLHFHHASAIPLSTTGQPYHMQYRLPLPPEQIAAADQALASMQEQEHVWVDRIKPRPRQVNIKPFIRDIAITDGALTLDLWVTSFGTARADELLRWLGIPAEHTVRGLERTHITLEDEQPWTGPGGPPTVAPATRPLEHVRGDDPPDETATPAATWGLSPHGPVVE